MSSFSNLYKKIYEHNAQSSDYISNFIKNPYSYLKARYYFITANTIVYLIQNLNFNPRYITFIYIIQGFVAMILLNLDNIYIKLIAIFLIFSKGTFDWADGHYARIKNKTSLTGHILDIYGARLNSVFFIIGLGYYQYVKYENEIFIYIIIFIPLFMFGYLEKYAYQIIFDKLEIKQTQKNTIQSKSVKRNLFSFIIKHKNYILNILDDRSRTVDLILFFIILEIFYKIEITYIFFILIFIKWFLIWTFSLLYHSSTNWSENIIKEKIDKINK